jgi:hypothetical protein
MTRAFEDAIAKTIAESNLDRGELSFLNRWLESLDDRRWQWYHYDAHWIVESAVG